MALTRNQLKSGDPSDQALAFLERAAPPGPLQAGAPAWRTPGLLRSPLHHQGLRPAGSRGARRSVEPGVRSPVYPANGRPDPKPVNAEDCAGQSVVSEARRARGQAAKANHGPGTRLRVALQRRPRTYPATLWTADALATAAPDTLANPTNASYRRHLSLVQAIPPVVSPPR